MSRRPLDRVLVVDVESTCWAGAAPEGQASEIIEIGLTVLDVPSAERVERRGLIVRPERSTISPFCTELTTLTQEQVEAGMSFADACSVLRTDYDSRDRVWASWGDYDRRQFQRQCEALGIAYPFGNRHLNVKTLFALANALPEEPGMAEALSMAGLQLEGTHHRGIDDAWNIAALLGGLLTSLHSPALTVPTPPRRNRSTT